MTGENDRDRVLVGVGDEILAAMRTISETAREALSRRETDLRSAAWQARAIGSVNRAQRAPLTRGRARYQISAAVAL